MGVPPKELLGAKLAAELLVATRVLEVGYVIPDGKASAIVMLSVMV